MFRRQRSSCNHMLRTASIELHIIGPITTCRLDMLLLVGGGRQVRHAHRFPFTWGGVVADAVATAAECHPPLVNDRVPLHDSAVYVDIADDGGIYAHDCRVIGEVVFAPLATHKPNAHIAEAIVHAAVVTHFLAPIARMKYIQAA